MKRTRRTPDADYLAVRAEIIAGQDDRRAALSLGLGDPGQDMIAAMAATMLRFGKSVGRCPVCDHTLREALDPAS